MHMIEISAAQVFAQEVLQRLDVPKPDAESIAEVLMDCELRGYEDHGIWFLAAVVTWYQSGQLNPRPQVRVLRDSPTITLLDGDGGCGVISATQAMEYCISKAKQYGISAAGVANSGNIIVTAPFVMQAAAAGLIGFASSNIQAFMPPVGGLTRTLGTNPMAYAVPTGRHFPVLFDMATSATAAAKIMIAEQEGQQLMPGLVEDSEGQPLTDASKFDVMTSLLLPIGGPKGYGLSMMIDVLSGVLTGSAFSRDLTLETDGRPGHFMWALDVEHFMPRDEFLSRMDDQIEQIKGGKTREGVDEIFVPGERGQRRKQQILEQGSVPLSTNAWGAMEKMSESMGIALPAQII